MTTRAQFFSNQNIVDRKKIILCNDFLVCFFDLAIACLLTRESTEPIKDRVYHISERNYSKCALLANAKD